MCQPSYREDRLLVHHALIRAYPLGTLITRGPTGLEGNPIPFVLDEKAGGAGVLRAHIARANRHWCDFDPQSEALVVFMGPQTYVSPSWSLPKQAGARIGPTWNYACAHAYGSMRIVEDRGWLLRQIRDLTEFEERDRPTPWSIDEAPPEFIEAMLDQIVGLEIAIDRIEGKWKVSQAREEAGRQGIIGSLAARGAIGDRAMAELIAAADAGK